VAAKLILILLFCLLPMAVHAAEWSDTSMTVVLFGQRVFNNLNMADTLNGNDRLDSVRVRRLVRDAYKQVGTEIGMRKSTRIETVDKTAKYLVDDGLNYLSMVFIKRNRFLAPVRVVEYEKFLEAYATQGTSYDTGSYDYATQYGDSIYLYPIPARVDTILVEYNARGPNLYADTNVIQLPHELYPAIEFLATGLAADKLVDAAKAQAAYAKYAKERDHFLRLYGRIRPGVQ
jgi:hypothetical protein